MVSSSVLIEATSSCSSSKSSETSVRSVSSSTSSSRGGVGKKYVEEGGLFKFSSATVIEASSVLNA